MLRKELSDVQKSVCNSPVSLMDVGRREVVACFHCRLIQFRTRTSLCRRCHKPLDGDVQNRIGIDTAGKRSGAVVIQPFDAVKNLGVRVRTVRRERSLTQRVLACRMDVPRTYISKVEMGRVVPTLATLWRVAVALEVTVIDLLSDEAERRRNDQVAGILEHPFLAEIAQVVGRFNPMQRALIVRAVRDAAIGNTHYQQQKEEDVL